MHLFSAYWLFLLKIMAMDNLIETLIDKETAKKLENNFKLGKANHDDSRLKDLLASLLD